MPFPLLPRVVHIAFRRSAASSSRISVGSYSCVYKRRAARVRPPASVSACVRVYVCHTPRRENPVNIVCRCRVIPRERPHARALFPNRCECECERLLAVYVVVCVCGALLLGIYESYGSHAPQSDKRKVVYEWYFFLLFCWLAPQMVCGPIMPRVARWSKEIRN